VQKIKFNPKEVTLLVNLPIKSVNLDKFRERAVTENLQAKKEFHITIIGSQTGEKILKNLQNLNRKEINKKITDIKSLAKRFSWEIILEDKFYFLKKEYVRIDQESGKKFLEIRKSIIQLAKCGDLDLFYKKLKSIVNINFELPLMHITLYTISTDKNKKLRGIGIYSEAQFNSLEPQKINI
jgi:hypothetical protein